MGLGAQELDLLAILRPGIQDPVVLGIAGQVRSRLRRSPPLFRAPLLGPDIVISLCRYRWHLSTAGGSGNEFTDVK
jgi:hypothetical protein